MAIKKSEKQELLERLNELLKKQSLFQQEINDLQLQITNLKVDEPEKTIPVKTESIKQKPMVSIKSEQKEIEILIQQRRAQKKQEELKEKKKSSLSSDVEKFIGENLINKIGIAVVIIGVGIGVKYAIDNNLISPLVRILLGYLVGFGLTFFAIRFKKKYFDFSAVLFSGAMAIHYFITYAAYSYYSLYPHTLTFVLMVLFTILTVALALHYNRQVIAHFGLVGAYLVPFLLKDPDSSILVLFTYMVIINSGILFISTKKRWKPLIYLAFIATWTIFTTWFISESYNNQLGISLIFMSLFFIIFYLVFLSYKLILKEKFRIDDIIFLLLNSGILYVFGYIAIDTYPTSSNLLGLFTFINTIIHGITALLIFYKSDEKDKNLLYWTLGIVLGFLALAVSIQFNEYITAILWAVEAAFIFWFGRTKKIIVFDYFAFALIVLTFIITVSNAVSVSYNFHSAEIRELFTPVFSIHFLSSFLVIFCFAFIFYISRKVIPKTEGIKGWLDVFNILFPVFFLVLLFFLFYTEIDLFWNNIQVNTSYETNLNGIWVKAYDELNNDVFHFKAIWLINYALLFASVLAFSNYKWIKNNIFNSFILALSCFLLPFFLYSELGALEILRSSYLKTDLPANYYVTVFHLLIRYVAYMFFALLFYSIYRFSIVPLSNKIFIKVFEVILSISIIWICSSELINWLSLTGSTEVHKHGLSILWGILSFALIGYGIWKKKKHLRITSITLFGGTIIKLFVYDLNNLETVPKTIVFLSIGILLLTVSYLYNKYRDIIFGSD